MFEKNQVDSYFQTSETTVLKSLPEGQVYSRFGTGEIIDLASVAKDSNGVLIHFWGTWCAPCEHELPAFLEFSKSLSQFNIKVVLLAVNDEEVKIKKFMKRFGELPENIILVQDTKNLAMPAFGVVKVPETFLFNNKQKNLTKFVGPQDWKLKSFYERVINLLAL